MPELPDVETFRRYLAATSLHREIVSVSQLDERILDQMSPSTLRRHTVGTRIDRARRHGKYLLAQLDSGEWLVMHFGMTGFLRAYEGKGDGDSEHVRARFDFDDGYHLAFHDQRLFGGLQVVEGPEELVAAHELGPDALDLSADAFAERLANGHATIKAALMDQRVLAGIGNVYSDEICFRARIDPRSRPAHLSPGDLRSLFRAMRHVLERAIEAKADPDEMPSSWITPRRKPDGASCPGCGGPLERHVVRQRSAYLCPRCQQLASGD